MITAAQMRAARALLGIDLRQLAELADVSLLAIQRMESSAGVVRGVVETLTKVVTAFDAAGVELIGENVRSGGNGRGVRFKQAASMNDVFFAPRIVRRGLLARLPIAPPPGGQKGIDCSRRSNHTDATITEIHDQVTEGRLVQPMAETPAPTRGQSTDAHSGCITRAVAAVDQYLAGWLVAC